MRLRASVCPSRRGSPTSRCSTSTTRTRTGRLNCVSSASLPWASVSRREGLITWHCTSRFPVRFDRNSIKFCCGTCVRICAGRSPVPESAAAVRSARPGTSAGAGGRGAVAAAASAGAGAAVCTVTPDPDPNLDPCSRWPLGQLRVPDRKSKSGSTFYWASGWPICMSTRSDSLRLSNTLTVTVTAEADVYVP